MGVRHLWTIFSPFCDRKPIYELQGKIVAIDLAGWVCESLNVVDYFVHPRQHLKNLFFRTTYLILENVTPIFVLEGTAPKLKNGVIAKRNELQFRGVKPKNVDNNEKKKDPPADKGRIRFNYVLKQCETLLKCMGVQCVQGPGEAEAYAAFLNKKGLVDGVISQDSDCFAYGAIKVYRNFSVSTQGKSAAQGGAVDVYDMNKIYPAIDFGQEKIIVMALLCGCDYCPEGIGGVGKDSVTKLFEAYKNSEIFEKIIGWRFENDKYTSLEMKVDDKNICSNCGHLGKTQSHSRNGCSTCRTSTGCDSTLWKERRLSIKAEITLRKKALADPTFPCKEIIDEFYNDPITIPNLNLTWNHPNLVKFIKSMGNLMQWTKIYCFQKFLPLLTRWQLRNVEIYTSSSCFVVADLITKKRTIKGIASYEIIWKDAYQFFDGLIPADELKLYENEHSKGIQELWITVEPSELVEKAYPKLVEVFLASKMKPSKTKKPPKRIPKKQKMPIHDSLNDMSEMLAATDEVAKSLKTKKTKPKNKPVKGLQMIQKFLIHKKTPEKSKQTVLFNNHCSTPKSSIVDLILDSDDNDTANFDLSEIVNGIVKNPITLTHKFNGLNLQYENVRTDYSFNKTKDDMELIKRNRLNISLSFQDIPSKRISLDDSFINLKSQNHSNAKEEQPATQTFSPYTHVDRFIEKQYQLKSNYKNIFSISNLSNHNNV